MGIQIIISLVAKAQGLIRDHETAAHVKEKGLADYVTQVDITVQDFLKEELFVFAPNIRSFGEETRLQETKGDNFQILDPVDKATDLIHDYQHSAISLALCCQREIVMGVVYDPFCEEVFSVIKGKGNFPNGRPIHVSNAEKPSNTMIGLGITERELADENFARFRRAFGQCQDVRKIGSATLELAHITCDRWGGYLEIHLNPWDYAAGMLLVQEAGGQVTDFMGKPLDSKGGSSVAGIDGHIHVELLKLL